MVDLLLNNRELIFLGLKTTLLASVIGLIGSLIIGTIMAIVQVSPLKIAKKIATAYVEFFRNIPLLVIVMFFFVVAPIYGFSFDGFLLKS